MTPGGFAELIGVEWTDLGPDPARARIAVEKRHKQPNGIVHGGVYASLAESITSAATYAAVADQDWIAIGMANSTNFLRPIMEGHVNALARPLQQGKTTWVWEVEISDDEGQLCAVVRMMVAVRERR